MSSLYLGLDIGDENVRAVLLSKNFRGFFVIKEIISLPLDENSDLNACLERIFSQGDFQEAICSVSIPAKELLFRSLKFPFKDKKKIQQAIAFEMEPLIPYPLDQIAFDYQINADGESSAVFVGIAPKVQIEEKFDLVNKYAKNVEPLAAGSISTMSALLNGPSSQEVVALLDISPLNTTCVICDKGELIDIRNYSCDLTTHADTEEMMSEGHLDERIKPLSLELKNTFELLIWNGRIKAEPNRLFLTGSGLEKWEDPIQSRLNHFLSIPVDLVDISKTIGVEMDEIIRKQWQPAAFNHALALAISPFNRGMKLNFTSLMRKDTFLGKDLRTTLIWAASMFLVMLFLAGVDFCLDYSLKKTELALLKDKMTRTFQKACPDVTKVINPVEQLKAKINDSKKGLVQADHLFSELSALEILREISVLVPPTADFTLKAFLYDGAVVAIKGEVKGFDAVDAIKKELGRSNYIENAVVGISNQIKQSDRVEFEMKLFLKEAR